MGAGLHAVSVGNPDPPDIAYVEFTSNVTISGTDATTPSDVVSSGAINYDGAVRVCVEFYASNVQAANGSDAAVLLHLWDASTDLGRMGSWQGQNQAAPAFLKRYLTPSAGSHTYRVRGWRTVGDGTVEAGSGGTGNARLPGYIRVFVIGKAS